MGNTSNTDNILSILDSFTLETAEDIAMKLAMDFRQRRIEIKQKFQSAMWHDLSRKGSFR